MRLFDDGWYVYSGAYADPWNWTCDTDPATLKPVKDYPVQIGDPLTGDVTYTTTDALPANHNPLRKLAANSETMDVVGGATYGCNFTVLPGKQNILDSVTFTSSDESVATVDAKGNVKITATEAGKTAVITATSNATTGATPGKAGEPKKASYTVNVKAASFADMDADTWKTFGIEYEDIDYTNDFILDVRPAENFAAGHLVYATNVPVAGAEDSPETMKEETKAALDEAVTSAAGQRIVVVCMSGNKLARNTLTYLASAGVDMNRVTYLIGGGNGVLAGDYKNNMGVSLADVSINNDYVLDVRPADQFAAGHLVKATSVPVAGSEVSADKMADETKAKLDAAVAEAGDKRIVVVCVRGMRLARNTFNYFQSAGVDLKKVTYLIGGATDVLAGEYKGLMGTMTVADDDVIVDVRPDAQRAANGAVAGAIIAPVSNPITDEQKAAVKAAYDANADKHIVILCVSGNQLAKNALGALQEAGADLKNVTYLIGGFNNNWKQNYLYQFGDVTVDPVAQTATIGAVVNKDYTDAQKAVTHLVLQQGGNDEGDVAPFITQATPLDMHAALTALGAKPWSDSARTLKDGQKLTDVKGDNDDFSYIDIKVDGKPLADCFDCKVNGADADPADVMKMAFSGNKTNQAAWTTGCVSCAFSCYAGIVTNAAVGFNTANEKQNYLYIDPSVLTGGQEVSLTYAIVK